MLLTISNSKWMYQTTQDYRLNHVSKRIIHLFHSWSLITSKINHMLLMISNSKLVNNITQWFGALIRGKIHVMELCVCTSNMLPIT